MVIDAARGNTAAVHDRCWFPEATATTRSCQVSRELLSLALRCAAIFAADHDEDHDSDGREETRRYDTKYRESSLFDTVHSEQ
jgi:hypothetical protein